MATCRDDEWAKNIYPVTKQSKSNRIALMINNIKFHNDSSDRHGAEKDDWVMFNLLQSLGYQVVRYNNLTGKQIDDALTQFSQHKKLTHTDSVFVTIMSHGDMGIISGTDSKPFKTEEIFQHLNAKNCPALMNKPKIIIIQACRGAEKGSVNLSFQQPVCTDNIRALSENFTRAVRVHIEKDFICFNSSTPHRVSYRSTSDGSFFIQTLADVFNKWSHEYDIEELFRKVMQHFEASSSDYLQMPTKERNTLTKRFYLFPDKKISVIILSKEESWAEGLITTILGNNSQETQKTENEIYTLVHIKYKQWDDFKDMSFEEYAPDMCLLVVEKTFSPEGVWQQIKHLNKKDKKPAKEFKAVLPLGCELIDPRIESWTLPQLFIELNELAKERKLVPIKRCGGNTEAPTPTGGRSSKERFTDHKKNLKRQHTATEVSLVLVGMTGTGKSASGNTILGKEVFMSKASSTPITEKCQEAETEINGKLVRVIDTPDIFDDGLKSSDKDKHVKKCEELQSDPCVYLLVMHVSRFTDGERDILKKLEKAFGDTVSEQTVILFTRGGDLQQAEMSLEDFLNECQPKLKDIIKKCGNRCVVFENRKSDSDQVKKLMDTVIRMLEKRQK